MSHFDLRRFKAIPDLPSRIVFCTFAAFNYFYPTLIQSSIHLLFSPVLKIEKTHAGNGSFNLKEVDDGVRATLRFLSKVESFPFFRSWLKRFKK